MNYSENVNWAQLRDEADLTLAEAAQRSGYSQATINGLEKHGQGSDRLKERLREIYTGSKLTEPAVIDWRTRALTAEAELRQIKLKILEIAEQELKTYPKPKNKAGK